MKLRNKKTGEIGNLVLNINPNRESYTVLSTENGDTICGNLVIGDYDTLADLNEEWEDYEEPKEFWFIDDEGDVEVESEEYEKHLDKMKQIGNYFETQEEAEKAVEKLKAWKRLKDKGARFKEWFWDGNYGTCIIIGDSESSYIDDGDNQNRADLDLLFGGEE